MQILKKIRIVLALFFGALITLLFLDFTGTLHAWFGWMAKIQFIPALLALNVGVIIGLILLTLLFGRIYCSIICPLGVFQDVISNISSRFNKNRFRFSSAINWLRYIVLALFIIAFIAGVGSFVALLEPYSAYGRIVSNIFTPFYQWGNNVLAFAAERVDSYAFYNTEVWMRGIGTLGVAIVTLIVIIILSWKGGRTYCNTICPVGTVLGFISRFSLFKIRFQEDKCNQCGLCERNCKASCIDSKARIIDHSRCVSCFNCINKCKRDAMKYTLKHTKNTQTVISNKTVDSDQVESTRRNMLTVAGAMIATSVLKAQEAKVDGGLAFIEDKKIPKRLTPIAPPGSESIRNFTTRCTACQLCVSVCPNQVLRPSTGLTTFMQPEVSYERGYCRPECTICSEVCPAGAIRPITVADKSSTQVGHAVWVENNCVVLTDGVSCGNCARHCPVGAIQMIVKDPNSLEQQEIPVIDTERCIGCGACENLCPSRPFSAIYVEGHMQHKTV